MDTRHIVAERINALCQQQNLTLHALAHRAGIPPSTLKNIIYGISRNPGIVTIKFLCDGLGISLTEFFETDEFRSNEPQNS